MQAGSVRAASPVRANAWQRQTPRSASRCSQLRQGSGAQSVPLKRANASERFQISLKGVSRTEGKAKPGRLSAAWQGSALPEGEMLIARRPQPPMQAFGRVAK